ncbi:MAG: hypothetical protein KF823_12610 [Xanthomonadales bacterium]|nr:hypothetical protein [Xanthomonadales bacterium]
MKRSATAWMSPAACARRWVAGLMLLAAAAPAAAHDAPTGGAMPANDFRTTIARAGFPALSTDLSSGETSYVCGNLAVRTTPHRVRYPFSLPDHSGPLAIDVWSTAFSGAPSLELRVRVSCLSGQQLLPVTQTLNAVTLPGTHGSQRVTIAVTDPGVPAEDCRFWLEAAFALDVVPCSSRWILDKVRVTSRVRDRIFRSRFPATL